MNMGTAINVKLKRDVKIERINIFAPAIPLNTKNITQLIVKKTKAIGYELPIKKNNRNVINKKACHHSINKYTPSQSYDNVTFPNRI